MGHQRLQSKIENPGPWHISAGLVYRLDLVTSVLTAKYVIIKENEKSTPEKIGRRQKSCRVK